MDQPTESSSPHDPPSRRDDRWLAPPERQQLPKARCGRCTQVIDVFVSPRRNIRAARRFFERAIGTTKTMPSEIVTDQAPTYPVILEELLPVAFDELALVI
jgi:hypothetical protein